MDGVQPWATIGLLGLRIGVGLLALCVTYVLTRKAPPGAAAAPAAPPAPVSGPVPTGRHDAGGARGESGDLLARENRAIEVVLGYVRAMLSFDRAAGSEEREEASQEVRRASALMDTVFGVPGQPGTVCPVPLGAPPEVLEAIARRCEEALRRRRAGAYAVQDPVEAAVVLARRPAGTTASAAGAVLPIPAVPPVSQPPQDRLAPYHRAFPAASDATAATGAFVPTPRMRFVKWLVETGRLSDDLPAVRGDELAGEAGEAGKAGDPASSGERSIAP